MCRLHVSGESRGVAGACVECLAECGELLLPALLGGERGAAGPACG